ncbi:MAG TPA: efflux RND transporter periplasmic adaptor subunit [Allosphingosinicella sp.]
MAAVAALAGCSGGSPQSAAAPGPSVLVTVQHPQRGTLPTTISAYGSAGPALNGAVTLSVAQPGQVTQLAVTDGVAVRAGQTLVTFATAPASRSAYQQAANALAAARKQRTTIALLLSQQLATHDQLVQADKMVADAAASLAALRAEGAGQAVRVLSAPFDGIVTLVSVAQGDRTQPGAPLVTVARASGIVVTVGVDPSERPRLRPGLPASLQRLSGGGAIAGSVLRVDSALNPRTRMIDVDLSFPAGLLLPGEAMRVAIQVGQVSGWLVPHRAVVTANGPARIFQMAAGKARKVPVAVMVSTPETDVVEGAIQPGRLLIVDGAYQVADGDAVRAAPR